MHFDIWSCTPSRQSTVARSMQGKSSSHATRLQQAPAQKLIWRTGSFAGGSLCRSLRPLKVIPVHHARCIVQVSTPNLHAEGWIHASQMPAHLELACTGNEARVADRLYDPDVYHLSSQQSSQLSSKLLDLVHSTPWHPLARKHLTTASLQLLQARRAGRGKPVQSHVC